MAKLRAIWRMARLGVLGLAVAVVVGLAAHPAEAYWRWNGYTYVWVTMPYYPPADYNLPPPTNDYSPPPAVHAPPDYGPSIGFRIH